MCERGRPIAVQRDSARVRQCKRETKEGHVRERLSVCEHVCVCERERFREEAETLILSECVCERVCDRQRQSERETERGHVRERLCVCVREREKEEDHEKRERAQSLSECVRERVCVRETESE